jgi:hypothetical protein
MYVDFKGKPINQSLNPVIWGFTIVFLHLVVESGVYTVDPINNFFSVFGTDERAYPEASLRVSAKQLLSLCVTLGEDPIIRYQTAPENDGKTSPLPYEGATKSLAMSLQRELDAFCRLNPNFPVAIIFLCCHLITHPCSFVATTTTTSTSGNHSHCRPDAGRIRTLTTWIHLPSHD